MLAAMSCTFEVAVEEPAKLEKEITITATSGEPDTRTEREADGSVLWSPGDQISLFYGSGTEGGSCFTAQNTEAAKTVNFTGTIGVITGGNNIPVEDTYFWAVYPYNATASCDGNSITTVLPSAQVAAADTFADDLFPSMGRSQGLNISFYNICGGLKFTVSEEGIKSVTLRSNAGEHIAGKITAGYDDNGLPVVTNIADGTDYVTLTAPAGETLEVGRAYYLVFVPTVFESGFTLTFSKGYSQAVKNRTAKTTIRRSVFGSMTNPDAGLEWEMLYVPIPDENFKSYMIQNFDTNGNGELDFNEAEAVKMISVTTDDITSLEGIESCINLESLSCTGTYSDGQDHGQLTSLDVSKNVALKFLQCNGNQLTTLDLSRNTALQTLNCPSNRLSSIDVSDNPALLYLYLSGNQLTSLDVSANTALKTLTCGSNRLNSLDVSANTALQVLSCDSNQLTSLDMSKNTALTKLLCHSNQLTGLDVSANTSLTYLRCDSNSLSILNVSNNIALTELWCYRNQISTLDISHNIALKELWCSDNPLTCLDLSQNTALEGLLCDNNQLASLDIGNNIVLSRLSCHSNQLTSLDLRKNLALEQLVCYGNQLMSLDLSQNVALWNLACWANLLTSLDVSQNPVLTNLDCSPMNDSAGSNLLKYLYIADDQQIPNVTVDRNLNNVPVETTITHHITIPDDNFRAYMVQNFDTNGNGILDLDEAEDVTEIDVNTSNIFSLSGIEYCPNLTILKCHGNTSYWNSNTNEFVGCGQLTSLDISNNPSLVILHCYSNKLTNLDVSSNSILLELFCYGNKLTSLDVSHNPKLHQLDCSSNMISSLDLSQSTEMVLLNCANNKLSTIDISHNTSLYALDVQHNPLASLDVSHNTQLDYIECNYCSLTSIDLSKNTELSTLFCYNNLLLELNICNNGQLDWLECSGNRISALDLSQNTQLTCLECNGNLLTNLDTSSNTALEVLHCSVNKITALNISKNAALRDLDCSPMNDAEGNNLLDYLYIAQGQQIAGVTVDRSSDNVPVGTSILVVPESGGNEGTGEESL